MQAGGYHNYMRAVLVWAAADSFFILSVVAAILLGMLAPDVQSQLNLDSTELGLLGSVFIFSYGISQFVCGRLLDFWGARLVLTLSALIAACGLYLFSSAESLQMAVAAQAIAGIGMSASYIGVIYLARMWFPAEKFPLISGLTQTSANVFSTAVILGLAFYGGAIIHFRMVMFRLALAIAVVMLLMLVIVRHTESAEQHHKNVKADLSLLDDLKLLLRIPQYWLSTLYFCAGFGVLLAFANLWNIPYQLSRGHSLQLAAILNAMLPLGGVFGAFVAGWWAERLASGARVAKFYSAGMLIALGVLVYGPSLPVAYSFSLLALTGFFLNGSILAFALADEHIPPSLRGTGYGLMAALAYLFSALLQYVIGFLLGETLEIPGTLAALHEFRLALSPLLFALAAGCIGSRWLRDAVYH